MPEPKRDTYKHQHVNLADWANDGGYEVHPTEDCDHPEEFVCLAPTEEKARLVTLALNIMAWLTDDEIEYLVQQGALIEEWPL